ncbi:MAG TPA: glutathione S-transferase family protein [Rhizomicrobium sp.]|jgi:glutathione S-transferase
MILIGQYDSPFVRRVAIALRELGYAYGHDTRSVFGDFAGIKSLNPLGRIPALALDDGTVLIESGAILDWLDETAGPGRALLPAHGVARRDALRLVSLACGAIEKIGAATYERLIRPSACRWPEWIARCREQGVGGIAALENEKWSDDAPLGQVQITTACMVGYVKLVDGEMMPPGRYPALDALSARCEARPAFRATFPAEYNVPRNA